MSTTVRTLIHVPRQVRKGDIVEIRATIAHVMETGHRSDSEGRRVPRDIVTRFECRLDATPVFAADVFAAVAANPYFAFTLRAERGGTLVLTWEGDRGFRHRETATLDVT
jgi:sulfur-oxidizing protein SoxZ